METKGKLVIDCERCGKSYEFLKEDTKFNESEKGDGSKSYEWKLNYNCLRCQNPISITYTFSVSADGKIADKNLEVHGAKVVEDSFEFSV